MYDPYEERQYWSRCSRGSLLNPYTRWCCRDCWIEQRSKYQSPSFDDLFDSDTRKRSDYEECSDTGTTTTTEPHLHLYNTLQLSPPKTISEIKKQYHKLSLLYHPDKNPSGEEQFKHIASAYHQLIEVV